MTRLEQEKELSKIALLPSKALLNKVISREKRGVRVPRSWLEWLWRSAKHEGKIETERSLTPRHEWVRKLVDCIVAVDHRV